MEQYFDQTGTGHVPLPGPSFCPYCGTVLPASGRLACSKCSFVHHDNPFPGVSVLIRNRRNKVLVGRRREPPHLWCLPCGFIEA